MFWCIGTNSGNLGHTLYREPTRQSSKDSNHYPSQKRPVIKTLTEYIRHLCEPENLTEELDHIERAAEEPKSSVG